MVTGIGQILDDGETRDAAFGVVGVREGQAALEMLVKVAGVGHDDHPPALGAHACDLEAGRVPADKMRKAAAEQLNGEFIQMTGKGHFPMAEDPVGFKQYFLPVLDKIKRG